MFKGKINVKEKGVLTQNMGISKTLLVQHADLDWRMQKN